jgi:hypothetical protein
MAASQPVDRTGNIERHPKLTRSLPHAPSRGVVKETEIDQLIAYMSLWWTDEQRVWQAQVTQRRAELEAEYGI